MQCPDSPPPPACQEAADSLPLSPCNRALASQTAGVATPHSAAMGGSAPCAKTLPMNTSYIKVLRQGCCKKHVSSSNRGLLGHCIQYHYEAARVLSLHTWGMTAGAVARCAVGQPGCETDPDCYGFVGLAPGKWCLWLAFAALQKSRCRGTSCKTRLE